MGQEELFDEELQATTNLTVPCCSVQYEISES